MAAAERMDRSPDRNDAHPAHERLVILDFGSQYTQLIARRVRGLRVLALVLPGGSEHSRLSLRASRTRA